MAAYDRLADQMAEAIRKHLVTGRPPVLPEAGRFFWQAFAEISGARSMHFSGPNPISFSEIEAWARLNRYPLADRHVAIIRAMDEAWLEHAYADRQAGQSTLPRSSGQPLTAAAFDAVFA